MNTAERILRKFPHITMVDEYLGSRIKTKFECMHHGSFINTPENVLRNKFGCNTCVQYAFLTKKYPIEELRKTITDSRYTVESYVNLDGVKVRFNCKDHGISFSSPLNIIKGKGCKGCQKEAHYKRSSKTLRKSTSSYREQVKRIHPKLTVIGKYLGANVKILHRCEKDHDWNVCPTTILQGKIECPICTKSIYYKSYELGTKIVLIQGFEDKALDLLINSGIHPKQIVVASTGKVPVIRYFFKGIERKYYPDIFIPKYNKIIEVKSTFTFGFSIRNNKIFGKSPKYVYNQNRAKAKAAKRLGYKIQFMVFGGRSLVKLPKNWTSLKYDEFKATLGVNC